MKKYLLLCFFLVGCEAPKDVVFTGKESWLKELKPVDVTYTGTVVRGLSRAHKIGFPTANIIVKDKTLKPGVYRCDTTFDDENHPRQTKRSMCYYGGAPRYTLESHIFNVGNELNLYGRNINVHLTYFVRSPRDFTTMSDLVRRVTRDASFCKQDWPVANEKKHL